MHVNRDPTAYGLHLVLETTSDLLIPIHKRATEFFFNMLPIMTSYYFPRHRKNNFNQDLNADYATGSIINQEIRICICVILLRVQRTGFSQQ